MTAVRVMVAALVVAVCGAVVAAPPVGASAPERCNRLKGKDLAPGRDVKLVRKRNGSDGTDLLGCMRPRGRVRRLASSESLFTTSTGYEIEQVAGPIVLLSGGSASQYGGYEGTSVFNIRTGRSYEIAFKCWDALESCDGNSDAEAAFVNRRGEAGAVVVPDGIGITIIAGFSSRGQRFDFDAGPSAELPAASLQLKGSTLSWTHAGESRSASIP